MRIRVLDEIAVKVCRPSGAWLAVDRNRGLTPPATLGLALRAMEETEGALKFAVPATAGLMARVTGARLF